VFALANYITYNTSDAILSGSEMYEIFNIPPQIGFFIAAAVATIIAIYGYSLIHFLNKLLFWPSIVALVALTAGVFLHGSFPPGAFDLSNFNSASFMTAFVIVAGFQLGWAPYVSDYSRYLPKKEGIRSTFWATYLASGLSGVWVFALGAVASGPNGTLTPVTAVKVLGDSIFTGLGTLLLSVLLLGLLLVMAINAYGGSLTLISMADSFKKVTPTKTIRLVALLVMGFTVWSIAQFVGEERFNSFYGNALIFLAYLFTPWTAVNLVDYFYVRKGVYVIGEIFNKDGIYGRWGWRGNAAYIIGFVSMVPFFVTAPYVGVIAKNLSSVDYSLFVGLLVSAVVYLLLARGIDLEKEAKMAAAEGHL
jgi:purine-cytosine permease-like protein